MRNGLRHVYWTMIPVLITETGLMEQVTTLANKILVYICLFTFKIYDERLRVLTIEGVGNDPREDRYFSIPKQVS